MVSMRSLAPVFLLIAGLTMAAPLQAQTTATLNVSARVVEECTVSAKNKLLLARLAKKLGDPDIVRRCSFGVVSRVDKQVLSVANLQPASSAQRWSSQKRVVRSTPWGKANVVLFTVSY